MVKKLKGSRRQKERSILMTHHILFTKNNQFNILVIVKHFHIKTFNSFDNNTIQGRNSNPESNP